MDFDEIFIPHRQQTIPGNILGNVIVDGILRQIRPFNQQLRIKPVLLSICTGFSYGRIGYSYGIYFLNITFS